MASNPPNGVADNIIDLQTFPILTEEVGSGAIAAPTTGGSSSAPLGALVENALRGILGWRPRPGDPKGFQAALKQSFAPVQSNGRTEWRWSPRSYTVTADIGAVTGAQASLYTRAQVALREALPILGRLFPLRSDADDEDIEASRAIVESDLHELVNELGLVGGPRVQRVDRLFTSLLGNNFDFTNPEEVQGGLGQLRERLGLSRTGVNTIDEERNLTDFFVLVDHVSAIKNTFDAQRNFFDRQGNDVFLGTQLVLLNRALSALAESVLQAYYVLDSVFVGAAERETIQLQLAPGEPTITIAELLSWTEYVATEEGPRLIREGGKDGVISLAPTLRQLADLLELARDIANRSPGNPIRGFHTRRVLNAFDELTIHADQSADLAEQLTRERRPAPNVVIESVDFQPRTLSSGQMLLVRIRVRNDGDEPVPTQGPAPRFTYLEGETFIGIGELEVEGAIRVGVDFQTRDGAVIDHPYRWGLGSPLAPGESRLIEGQIILTTLIDQNYWGGLVHELVEWIDTGESQQILISVVDPASSQVAASAESDPSGSTPSPRSTRGGSSPKAEAPAE